MAFTYSNSDSLFTNDSADADGAVVLVRWNDIKTYLNGGNFGPSSLDLTGVYSWTSRHAWTITDTANNNRSLTANGVMAANRYGDYVISAAAQINSALSHKELSNAASSVPVDEIVNAGTGDSHQVTNSNTGSCYSGITSSTGPVYKASVRSLSGLQAPLVSQVVTSPTTVAVDATETIVADSELTLPANFLIAGSTIKGTFYGVMTTPGAAPANIQFRVRIGGIAGTVLLDSGAVTPTVSLANSLVKIEFLLTCITTGAGGTVEAQGILAYNHNSVPTLRGLGVAGTGASNAAAIAVDTTVERDLVLTLNWSAATAGCSVSIRSGVLEIKK